MKNYDGLLKISQDLLNECNRLKAENELLYKNNDKLKESKEDDLFEIKLLKIKNEELNSQLKQTNFTLLKEKTVCSTLLSELSKYRIHRKEIISDFNISKPTKDRTVKEVLSDIKSNITVKIDNFGLYYK